MTQRTHSIVWDVPADGIQRAEMLGQGDKLRTLEIHTDAGIIRVNTNLENTQDRRPVVVVEIEPNTSYKAHTPAGGDWIMEWRNHFGGRLDVTLTKDG